MAQLSQRGLVDFVGATETRQYKDKTFVSRVLIIEQPRYDQYTGEKQSSNYIKFEATKEETCAALDNFPVGTKVDVEFIARGSKFAKKDGSGDDVFVHLEVRNITLASNAPAAQAAPAGAQPLSGVASAPVPAAAAAPAGGAPAGDYDPDLGF